MPIERIAVHLKPSGFFEKNPALDVPASNQHVNQSELHKAQDKLTMVNGCCDRELVNGSSKLVNGVK